MERLVADIDEDIITMAPEAASSALIYAGTDGSELERSIKGQIRHLISRRERGS